MDQNTFTIIAAVVGLLALILLFVGFVEISRSQDQPRQAVIRPKLSNKAIRSVLLLLILMVCAIGVIIIVPRLFETSYVDASRMCQVFVKESIISPLTAQFPDLNEAQTTDLGNKTWSVVSYVDAQNNYGALIRSTYTCKVKYVGNDRWHLDYMDIEPY